MDRKNEEWENKFQHSPQYFEAIVGKITSYLKRCFFKYLDFFHAADIAKAVKYVI